MKLLSKQYGMGSIGLLLTLLTVGFALLCVFRLGPHYIDHIALDSALKSLAEHETSLGKLDKRQIHGRLERFLTINNVRGDEAKSFKITKQQDKTLITSQYEKRVHLVLNIDVVLTFKSQLDTSKPEKCCEYLIETK